MKQTIINFLKSNQAKTAYWTTANTFIVLLIGLATTIQPDVINPTGVLAISALVALLNMATKYINKKL